MATFGWLIFIIGGAYIVFQVAFIAGLTFVRGGLESIPAALAMGTISAAGWLVFSGWLSPFSVTFNN